MADINIRNKIAVDAGSNSGVKASVSSYSWNHTVGSLTRGILIVGLAMRGGASANSDLNVSGVTYNGVSLTKAVTTNSGDSPSSNTLAADVWYLVNPSSGTNSIAVTFQGTVNHAAGYALSLSQVDQKNPLDQTNSNHALGQASPVSNNVTINNDNGWAFDVIYDKIGTAMTKGASQTLVAAELSPNGGGDRANASYRGPVSPAAATAMSWTYTGSDDYAQALSSFAPAPIQEAVTVSESVSVSIQGAALSVNVSDNITISESVSKSITGLACGNLTQGSSTTDGTVFTTASITPAANALLLLTIISRADAVQPTIASISGNGLTWVEIDHVDNDNSGSRRTIHLYRAMGASPSAGAVTITFNATQTACTWTIDQITGADTAGTNGSGAIVQSANNVNRGAGSTSITATLPSAFSNVNNGTYGAFGTGSVGTSPTAGSGFSQISSVQETGESSAALFTEWKNVNDTTIDVTSASDTENGIIGVEIKFATTDLSVNVSESISVSENIVELLESFINVSNGVTVSESVKAELNSFISSTDSISLSDAVNLLSEENVNKTESITITENVSVSNPNLGDISRSDSITVTESAVLVLEALITTSDQISTSESVNVALAHQINVSDTVTTSEAINVALTHQISLADNVSLTESLVASEQITVSKTESITITENVSLDIPIYVQSPALIHYQPFGKTAIPPNWQEFGNATWTYTGSILTQSAVGTGDPQKVLYTGASSPLERVVQALVTFDTLNSGTDNRGGITILGSGTTARGYNLVLRGDNSLSFLNDIVAWGPSTTISPVQGESWWFKAMYLAGVLYGKAWKDGTIEPGWMITWTQTPDVNFIYSGITGNSSSNTAKYSYDEFSYYGVPDTITVSESDLLLRTSFISVSENVSLSESVGRALNSDVNVSESVSVAENTNASIAHQISVSDSISLTESSSVAREVNGDYAVSVSDTISVSESTSELLESLINVNDSVSISENVAEQLSISIAKSESITVTENTAQQFFYEISVSDTISLSESHIEDIPLNIAISDSVSVTDTNTVQPLQMSVAVQENVTVTENTLETIPELFVTKTETITVSESISIAPVLGITVSDSVSVSESLVMFTDKLYLSTSETVTVRERIIFQPEYFKNQPFYLDIGQGLSMMLGAPRLAVWGTNGRPQNPRLGEVGINDELGQIEVWIGSWIIFPGLTLGGGIFNPRTVSENETIIVTENVAVTVV